MKMALDNENMGTTMLVQPAGGVNSNGFGFGDGNGFWILLLFLLLGNGGWGGGFGGFDGGLYPWMNNSQNINNGFSDQMLNDNITSIRDGVYGISNQLCSGFAGVNATVNGAQNAITQQMYTNQIADMQQNFALQSQLAQCCCDNRAATADLKYTVATEACADRAAISDGIRDVITAQTANTQSILDKLCALELDGYKRENDNLRQQLNMAQLSASQVDQTAQLRANQATVANQLVAELRSCPIPSQPVYGNQPIFTCGGNTGCGCSCGVA
jgi:hypothetical protein